MTEKDSDLEHFFEFRREANEKLQDLDNLELKRFLNLDSRVYDEGELSASTKEMLGLVASLVLKCDDCISYHLDRCLKEGVSRAELAEVFSVALIVGGSIVIPHLRRAVTFLDKLEKYEHKKEDKQENGVNYSMDNRNKDNKKGKRESNETIEVFTDGACSNNPGPGGYAAVIYLDNKEKEITGFVEDTTNNRMELEALIHALREIEPQSKVKVYTDSNYLLQGVEEWLDKWQKNGWQTAGNKAVKNKDLWQEISELKENYQLELHKVKAHSDNKKNQLVDKLAKKAIEDNVT
ncbi:MAG: ribonuclease HI [Bacillota bacterium]